MASDAENSAISTHSTVHVADPAGGAFVAEVCTWIDADRHPGLLDQLQQGTLHRVRRPNGEWLELGVSVAVRLGHRLSREPGRQRDPDDHLVFVPDNLAHRALEERARVLERMDQDLPGGRTEVVVGTESLKNWVDSRLRRRSSPRHQLPKELEPYSGSVGSTIMRPFNARDAEGRNLMTTVYTSINLDEDPGLMDELLDGTLNQASSDERLASHLPVPVAIHKPSELLFVFYVPTALAHRVNSEKARLVRRLSETDVEIPQYVLNFDTAVGVDALRQNLAERQSAVVKHTRKTPVSPLPRVGDEDDSDLGIRPTARAKAPGLRRPRKLDPDSLLDPDFEFMDEDTIRLGLRARERVRGPDSDPNRTNPALRLMSTVPHRFPEGREPRDGMFTLEGTPVPLIGWQVTPEEKDLWMRHRIRLLVQFQNLETYPLVALLLAAAEDDGTVVDELVICLNAAEDEDRQFLEALADRFVMTVAIYGPSGSLTDAAQFVGNLELNLERILESADHRLERDSGDVLNWDDAVERFRNPHFPRIGPMRHPFAPQMFSELDTPNDTQLAVSILSYWSQEPNHRYLIYNQSFSEARFRIIQQRVLEHAVEFGLRLPPMLRRLACHQLDRPPEQLMEQLLANFAEVHLNLKANDLDAYSLWENWRLLLEDAEEYGVDVDQEILELAREALSAAQAEEGAETP